MILIWEREYDYRVKHDMMIRNFVKNVKISSPLIVEMRLTAIARMRLNCITESRVMKKSVTKTFAVNILLLTRPSVIPLVIPQLSQKMLTIAENVLVSSIVLFYPQTV